MKKLSFSLMAAAALVLSACGASGDDANANTINNGSVDNGSVDNGSVENGAVKTPKPSTSYDECSSGKDLPVGVQEMCYGLESAPVTLIEYASVTCIHCAHFHEDKYPEIKEKFIETGKVKLVFREIPTPPNQLSVAGFTLARCAAEKHGKDAYFAMLDKMFVNQDDWTRNDPLNKLIQYSNQAGMDREDFNACLERDDIIKKVYDNAVAAGKDYEISGTPNFVLEGVLMEDHYSTDEFIQAIEDAVTAAESK